MHSFAVSIKTTRKERAAESLVSMGTSVFSGITLTKFGGIIVLGFAQNQIFKVSFINFFFNIISFSYIYRTRYYRD